jgi:hypothetical protein
MDPNRAATKATAVTLAYVDVFGSHITRGELLYLLSVAEHETHCGDDWKDRHGNGVHNWGAVQWRVPTADELVRIKVGDLHVGDTIPGGILQQDSSPGKGQYYVFFRAYGDDRQGAASLVATLYKHNPEARAVAQAVGSPGAFCAAMYRRGYFEGVHPGARPAFGPKGELLRSIPLNTGETANVDDYASAVSILLRSWSAALASFPMAAPGIDFAPERVSLTEADEHEALAAG